MLPATDPADAVTASLVCYESSSGDDVPLVGDRRFARYKNSALGSRTESEPALSICSDDATGNCCALIPAALTRSALAETEPSRLDVSDL